MADIASPARLRAARVGRAHGVRGEVRLIPLGGDPDRFQTGLRLHVDSGDRSPTTDRAASRGSLSAEGGERSLRISAARCLDDGTVLASFDGVTTREEAQALTGACLCIDRGDRRPLGEDEWFVHELVGLQAVTPLEEPLGRVTDVEAYPGQDVLVVSGSSGERRFPMARAFIERVDVAAGLVVITPWEEA